MASLSLPPHTREGALEVVHYVEARTDTEEVDGLELDPRTHDNNRVKSIEETSIFQLGLDLRKGRSLNWETN